MAGALAAAAAALVIVGVVAFTGGGDGDGEDTTVAAESPLNIAQRFMEARDAWDGDAILALVADDAKVSEPSFSNPDQYASNADFEHATGWRLLQSECTTTVQGPPAEVTCTYVMQNDWSQALGTGPFTGSTFNFVIEGGLIQEVGHNFDFSEFSTQGWNVFARWVRDTHPDDFTLMYETGGTFARTTPEAIVLWEQFTAEFVASPPGS